MSHAGGVDQLGNRLCGELAFVIEGGKTILDPGGTGKWQQAQAFGVQPGQMSRLDQPAIGR